MNLIKRYAYHFDSSKCEFDDVKSRMNLEIKGSKTKTDNIILGIDSILQNRHQR